MSKKDIEDPKNESENPGDELGNPDHIYENKHIVDVVKKSKDSLPLIIITFGVFLLIMFGAYYYKSRLEQDGYQQFTFDRTTAGFYAIGEPEGKITQAKKLSGLKPENGALVYTYENYVDRFTGVGTMNARLQGFSRIKIRMFSKTDRLFLVSVDEIDDGAVYVKDFRLEGGKWEEFVFTPDEFQLSVDSQDENNKIDITQLNTRLVITDMSGYEGVIGQNKFYIANIEIWSDSEEPAANPD